LSKLFNMRKDRKEIQEKYYEGYSCSQLATMYGVTRQSIHSVLTRLKTNFRKTQLLPFIMYDDKKWTISKTTGYYRATTDRKKHVSLHRYVWEKYNGAIPVGYDVHHIDNDKTNNVISNLECLPKSEHTRLYSPHHNQFKNYKTISNGTWKDKK
jgi:hypothetical protein